MGEKFDVTKCAERLCLAFAGDEAEDQQHDARGADREKPGLDREEVLERRVEQRASDETKQSADDAEHQSDKPSTALVAGKDCLRDSASEQSKNDLTNDSHNDLPVDRGAAVCPATAGVEPDLGTTPSASDARIWLAMPPVWGTSSPQRSSRGLDQQGKFRYQRVAGGVAAVHEALWGI